ncbi:hypothetical protein [Campylobacter sp. RM16192]|uniref:hypothetical protein n=1 Tax=Campylobacter sp. RM16192 TaxID=1660080 RepID=UPI001452275C|nr:hypothetical protein [Campylobacter sp. RM16192]QCD52514.1 hypothetical protein CDOMC_0891 [Campylobacter sp. RM16192]
MNEIQNFFSNLHVYWQAAIIGIAGGLLGKDEKNSSMNNVKGWRFHLSGIAASTSSAFTCLIVYLIVHPITNSDEFSLGIGGYCAWRGAEWTKHKINKLLDRRLSGDIDHIDYSYVGGADGATVDRRKKHEDDESEYPRPPRVDMNENYKMME